MLSCKFAIIKFGTSETNVPSGAFGFTSVSAGTDHTCGITEDGELLCWGDDSDGQLGAYEWVAPD